MTDDFRNYMQNLINNIEVDPSLPIESEIDSCETCNGIGMVAPDVPPTHHFYKKLIPCPHCEKGQANQRQIHENRIKQTELPVNYQNANINDWWRDLGSDDYREGKRLAYLTAIEFINALDHTISSHAVAERVKRLMQSNTPDWIHKILLSHDQQRIGFAFYGPVGTGKTWLAAAVMNALIDKDEFVLYMRAQDIIQSLKSTWNQRNNDDETEDAILDRYKNAPFLFIDDMNLELRGQDLLPFQKDYMEAIIRHRSNHRLRTFITCNIGLDQFYSQWGDRTGDVLAADLQWVKVGGSKLRQTNQKWEEAL